MDKPQTTLLPCPLCGAQPEFWNGAGTQADLSCTGCGYASVSVQVSDMFDYDDDRRFAPMEKNTYQNRQDIIDFVNAELTEIWNGRATN